MSEAASLGADSALFKLYLFWSAVLVIKTLCMSFLTSRQRRAKHVLSTPEDVKVRQGKVQTNDPDVERVRRAHRNDLENVLPFLILCPLYLATGPSPELAAGLIRAFAAARIAHSVLYLNEVAGFRSVAFVIGVAVTLYMAAAVIVFAW